MRRLAIHCLVPAVLAAMANIAAAQQVTTDPASTHIFPAGGQRGTTIALRVGGECLPPHTRIRWWGDGIVAPTELGAKLPFLGETSLRRKPGELHINYPKEWESSVSIAADATLGTRLWRLSCGRGGTGGRVFVVGDLPEFVETESNSTPAHAERVALPVTINGQIDGERDMDYYVFAAEAGQVVTAEVAALRLGSPLDAILEVHGADGRRQPVESARLGSDPVHAFLVPRTGDYRLSVAHINYQGGPQYVYRVTLSTAACVLAAFPGGWQAGQSREIEFPTLPVGDASRSIRQLASFDAGSGGEICWRDGIANSMPLEVGTLPEIVEAEPNETAKAATPLALPMTANGRFQSVDDEDWYVITVPPAVPLRFECRPWPHGGAALPLLDIVDANGGVLATAKSVEAADRICRIDAWAAPAEATYYLRLRDLRRGSAGGPEYVYRLTVAPAAADFELSLPADFANVIQGGRTEVDVRIARRGGFADPVDITAGGLPEGVTSEPLRLMPGQETAKLVLNATVDARPQDVPLRVMGTAVPADPNAAATSAAAPLVRIAAATHLGHDVEGVGLGPTTSEHLQLTVQHKPMFRLFCNEAYQYAYRGTVYPYLMEVERLDGFDGPIELEIADRQIKDLDGIEVLKTVIEPRSSSVMLPIYLPETMHINVQAHSNVYAQGHVTFTDRWGQPQSLLVVSTMRCMIRPLPTIARLHTVDRGLSLPRGGSAACRLRIDRTSNFAGSVRVELMSGAKTSGFTAEPVTIAADQTECTIVVRAAADAAIRDNAALIFRATGDMPGGVRLVSEAHVSVRLTPE